MESLGSEIWTFFAQYGLGGGLGAIFLGLYIYERKVSGEKIEALHRENIETLKIILPLVQKFQTTMDTVLPLLMRDIDRRQG